jgi:hypothetical protein
MSRDSDLTHILKLRGHLLALPEGSYVDRHGEPSRHPGGLYSHSVSKVLVRMRELVDTFSPQAHPAVLRQSWPSVMSALEALLVAVDSHGDDIKTILAVATKLPDKTLAKVSRQTDEVLKELAAHPINRVRHHGEKFEACYCVNSQFALYGYYVSAPRPDGVIAPSTRAHGSSGTHWSFPVSLRRLLGQLVRVARIVCPHMRGTLAIAPSTWTAQERSDLRSVATWVYRCPPYCFPNQVDVRVPDLGLSDELYLRLDTIKKLRSVHTQPGVVWTRTFSGDGVSRQFAVA